MLNFLGLNPDQMSGGQRIYEMPAGDQVQAMSRRILEFAHDLDADSETLALALANVVASMAMTLDEQNPEVARVSIDSRLEAFTEEVMRRFSAMQGQQKARNS
jgi:hypothetical protein